MYGDPIYTNEHLWFREKLGSLGYIMGVTEVFYIVRGVRNDSPIHPDDEILYDSKIMDLDISKMMDLNEYRYFLQNTLYGEEF